MNMMMTTIIAAPPSMVARVEATMRARDMRPTTFGRRAIKDPHLVFDLRRGRKLRPATERRVCQFIATLDLAVDPVPPIALLRSLPPGPLAKEHLRLQRLAELFAAFDRDDMELGVELLLAEMDARDGDPDEDTGGAEDEPLTGQYAMSIAGPGCPVSDVRESTAEWDVDQRRAPDAASILDDEEDDDPAGDRDPDREAMLSVPEEAAGRWGEAHGALHDDDDELERDDPAARRKHLRRARRALVSS